MAVLQRFAGLSVGYHEALESPEQLRFLENGISILPLVFDPGENAMTGNQYA